MKPVKRYSNVGDLFLFRATIRTSFLLNRLAFSFFYERSEGSCMYRSGTVLLIKCVIASLIIIAKNKIQETTLRNSCYFDNCKTRLSMTKCRALRNKYQKKYDVM